MRGRKYGNYHQRKGEKNDLLSLHFRRQHHIHIQQQQPQNRGSPPPTTISSSMRTALLRFITKYWNMCVDKQCTHSCDMRKRREESDDGGGAFF